MKAVLQKIQQVLGKIWRWLGKKWHIPLILFLLLIIAIGSFVIIPLLRTGSMVESKLTLRKTPTVITEVHQLGELIGAEYYGEVVHTMVEAYEDEDWRDLENSYREIKNMYGRIYDRISRIQASHNEVVYQSVDEFMDSHSSPQQLYNPAWFEVMMDIKEFEYKAEDWLLEKIRNTDWEAFRKQYKRELDQGRIAVRKEKNKGAELVYLGRGKVKAGFDLRSISSTNIERKGDILFIHNTDPLILTADINPWFIPPAQHDSGGIKGFEVLRESGTISSNDRKRVKQGCKWDLIQDAWKVGIMQTAEKTAEETLLNFFQLMESDSASYLTKVDIVPSSVYQQQEKMWKDQQLDAEEVLTFKNWLQADSIPDERKDQLKETFMIRARGGKHHASWYEWKKTIE